MAYSLPYVLLLIFFAVLAVIFAQRCENEKDKTLCAVISFVAVGVFYIFFAFRGYVYTDWIGYSESYSDVEWGDVLNIINTKKKGVLHEPGFTLLMCICQIFSDEYAFLVMVITAIDTFLFVRFLNRWNVRNIAFAMMLFLLFNGILLMFNMLRNQIAIFLFLNALEYIEKKQIWKYFAWCLIALCFHASSIIFFPLYFVLSHKLNKWFFLGGFLFILAFFISQISLLSIFFNFTGIGGVYGEKAELYSTMFTSRRLFSLTNTIEKCAIVGLVFCYYDKLTAKKSNIILINCYVFYLFFFYMFAEIAEISSRLALLFEFSNWMLWIIAIDSIKQKNNKRLVCAFIFIYSLYSQALNYPNQIQQYDNLLFGAKSQEERLIIREKTFDKLK